MYDQYTDGNGVTWTIATNAGSMFASVAPDSKNVYVPPAEGFSVIVPTPGDGTLAEVQRVAFIRLRERIDGYMADHKQNVGLSTKTPPKSFPWAIAAAVGLAILLLGERR